MTDPEAVDPSPPPSGVWRLASPHGLDLGVISPTLFAMMVLMALATTVATTPLLQLTALGIRH
jgi:hypothetical protein